MYHRRWSTNTGSSKPFPSFFFFPLLLPGQKNDFDTSIDVIISTQPASRFIALLAVASRSENDSFDPRRYVYP